jgi:hypothetical protein
MSHGLRVLDGLDPLWGEAQPLAYKYVHLSFDLIEHPFFPS